MTAIVLFLLGCHAEKPAVERSSPISLIDDANQPVELARPAARIISLVPSGTETVMALGARARLVGRTTYDHDSTLARLPVVGGGLDPNIETVVGLRPDLVLVWASEARGAVRKKLAEAGVATIALSLQDTTDVYRAVEMIGRALGLTDTAQTVLARIRTSLRETAARADSVPRRRVFYVVYNDPPMTAGPATFIGQILGLVGGDNIFGDLSTNWPTVEIEELLRRDPDVIILPIGEMPAHTVQRLRHEPGWRDLRAVRSGCVIQVDADLANRPGPNLATAAETLRQAIHDPRCGISSVK